MKYKIILFALIAIMLACSSENLQFPLEKGMTKSTVLDGMGSPNNVITSSDGTMYEYWHYDHVMGWCPEFGKKYLYFDANGVLRKWYGVGYEGTR